MSVGQKVFDFAKIAARVPPGLRGQLGGLRQQYAAAQAKLESMPAEPAAIDFAAFESQISSPKFVSEVKTMYSGVKYEYPADENSAAINAAEKTALSEVLAENPELAKQIEAEIKNEEWA